MIYMVLLAGIALTGCTKRPTASEIVVGSALPAFCVVTNDGQTVGSQDFDNGFGLIVFFHTACPDCQRELPIVQSLFERYSSLMRFLAIGRNQNRDDVERYWQENGLTIPCSAQEDAAVFRLFAAHTVPRSYLIHDGVVISQWADDPIMTEQDFTSFIHL